MDRVVYLLKHTLSTDINQRNQSEAELKELSKDPNFCIYLIQGIMACGNEQQTQLVSIIYCKNYIKKYYDSREQTVESTKVFIRENIFNVLGSVVVGIEHVIQIVYTLLVNDYNEQNIHFCNYFNTKLVEMLNSTTLLQSLAVQCLLQLIKVYQWKPKDKRIIVETFIYSTLYPQLLQLAMHSTTNTTDIHSMTLLKNTLKCYYTSIQYDSPLLETLPNWYNLLSSTLLLTPVPSDMLLKAKKWSCHSLNRLHSRHTKEHPTLLTTYSTATLQLYLTLLPTTNTSTKLQYLFLSFFTDCIKHKSTWTLLKDYYYNILTLYCYPLLSMSPDNIQLFTCDPIEFINSLYNPLDDYSSPSTAATSFLLELVLKRRKTTFMPIIQFISTQLSTLTTQDAPTLDGILSMLGNISDVILSKQSPVKHQIESVLLTTTLPLLTCNIGYLRARACDVFGKFSELEYTNTHNITTITNSILLLFMNDTDMPVKIEAAITLQSLLHSDTVQQLLLPHIPQIMEQLLLLMNDIDIDTLSSILEEIVQVYSDQMGPFAIQLSQRLRDTYLRLLDDITHMSESDQVTEKTFAAMGVLKTLSTLVLSLESASHSMLEQLEVAILPVIRMTLEKDQVELFEDVFSILDSLTFFSKSISEPIWSLFDLIHHCYSHDGHDFLEEMSPSLDNYISYGKDVFVSNPHPVKVVFDIIQTSLRREDASDGEIIAACDLAESMLLNLRGNVDALVGPFIDMALYQLKPDINVGVRIHSLDIVLNALYYSPVLALTTLIERGALEQFIKVWLENSGGFKRVHDKKLCILAILSMVGCDVLPVSLVGGLMSMLVLCFNTFEGAVENRRNVEKLYESDEGGVEGEDDDAWLDEDDVSVAGSDGAYYDYVSKVNGEGEESDEDWDEVYGLEEDVLFETPLDCVDVYVVMSSFVQSGGWERVRGVVGGDVEECLRRVVEEGEKRSRIV